MISAAAWSRRLVDAAVVDLGGETMGTRWSVRFARPAGFDDAALHAAIVARLDGLVAEMSHWLPTSRLMRFNRSAVGSWTVLPPDFAHVMAIGLAIARNTDGAFDPAIGRLVDLWGFGAAPVTRSPAPEEVAEALRCSGWNRLTYSPPDRRLRQPGGLALDLSGIAKGHAVDTVADLLARHGIDHALIEIGGELVGRGVRPDGEPWWVELETPPGLRIVPLRIALHGLAVATSGDYQRGAHTLDPRTGRSTGTGVVSASVVHETALAADAWATALAVLGPHEGLVLADEAGIAARIITTIDGETREWLSACLTAMIDGD